MANTVFIEWVQGWSTPFLDSFWQMITLVGDMEFYMIVIPVLFWVFNKHFAMKFGIIFLFSAYFNSISKYNFVTERPPLDLHKIDQPGYAFPSGHAQGNTVFWGYLAQQIGQKWAYIAAGVLVFLVAFSRLYLGVHYPVDVIFGIAIGLALLGIYRVVSNLKLEIKGIAPYFLLSGAAAFLLFLMHSQGDGPLVIGFFLGAFWGYILEREYVQAKEKAKIWQNIIKVVLGLVVLFVLREVTRELFINLPGMEEDQMILYPVMTVVRYSIMGFWVSFIAPLLFKTLRLDQQ